MTTRTTNDSAPLPGVAARAVPYLPLGLLAGLGAVLAYLWKYPCRFGGAWNGGVGQFTNFCYTDIYPLFWAEKLNEGKVPYVDYPVEYPVGIGGIMEFARRLAGGDGVVFYDVTVILMGIALVAGVLLTAALAGPARRWDALWYAVGPAVILCAYINWDLAAGALALGGLLAWARNRPWLAGVLLSLAVATKFYPLMFFGALFLLTVRTAKWVPFLKTVAAAAAAWLLVNVPIMLVSFEGWKKFYAFSSERGADWGGLWFFFQKTQWFGMERPGFLAFLGDAEKLNTMAMAALAVLLLGVAVLALAAPRRPRLMQLCFLALAAFMITNKVWSPQYVLWLVPFAVLARPKWGALAAWQIAECWYFFSIWLYLVSQYPDHAGEGIGDDPYFLSVWARALTIVILMALVVRDILRPEHDVVRQGEVDDPSGGVFDHAEDRLVLRRSLLARGARSARQQPETA
ncbi:glycosyltransferase family 87 protein [Microbispora bryophytorum]|uniref:glycosyltransferase family 87 protein n=1 Tax=Microbispora bryophytorum TaxID=1460882 RepID=UPI0033F4E25C